MNLTLNWQALGVIIAIIGHGAFSIWWASKINTTVTIMSQNLLTNFQRIDTEIAKLWKRSEEIRDLIKDSH